MKLWISTVKGAAGTPSSTLTWPRSSALCSAGSRPLPASRLRGGRGGRATRTGPPGGWLARSERGGGGAGDVAPGIARAAAPRPGGEAGWAAPTSRRYVRRRERLEPVLRRLRLPGLLPRRGDPLPERARPAPPPPRAQVLWRLGGRAALLLLPLRDPAG